MSQDPVSLSSAYLGGVCSGSGLEHNQQQGVYAGEGRCRDGCAIEGREVEVS